MPDRDGRGKQLGLLVLTALVVGNMVGSGVFGLPAALAPFGGVSVLGWGVSAVGSMALGLVMARLARRHPTLGGPYAYVREAFGDFAAFLVGWSYWISCWCAQAAIAIAMVGYLGDLVPALRGASTLTALFAIAVLCAVNIAGVKEAGAVQFVTTVLKVLPLVAIAAFGFARFDATHFEPMNPTGDPLPSAIQACLALTLWAFMGFESAAFVTAEARDPRRDVPRATLIGIGIATVLYVVATTAVMGLVPRAELARSSAPFADAARALWGPGAGKIVAAGAVISCFGALNGWILISGQVPRAIAGDGLFPAFFGRLSARGTPASGLALSSGLAGLLVLTNYAGSLVAVFGAMVLLSTIAALVLYVFCAMADILLAVRARRAGAPEPLLGGILVACAAFGYGLLAIGGAGHATVFWGFLLLLAGIPFYVLARSRSGA